MGDYVTTDDGRTGLVTLDLNGWSRVRFHHGPARRTPREQTFREWDLKPTTAEAEKRARAVGLLVEAERSWIPQAAGAR